MEYLICYDIADDRRRRRVVRLIEGYGQRLHESAYSARLRPGQAARLLRALEKSVDRIEDRVTLYPVCGRDHPDRIHLGAEVQDSLEPVLVV